MAQSRINRNILECKDDFRIVSFLRLPRINRNILECKVTLSGYTYDDGDCINRNILECKGQQREERAEVAQQY